MHPETVTSSVELACVETARHFRLGALAFNEKKRVGEEQ